jgi:peptidoglycan/xylan/chitin deacetylase (PgdA/CDA1 family)
MFLAGCSAREELADALRGEEPAPPSYVSIGSPEKRSVALTFDDGPSPYTGQILEVLERLDAPATFFQVGEMRIAYPEAAAQVRARGFPVGDHTRSHPRLIDLDRDAQRSEIFSQPRPARMFRPPYGKFNATTLELLRRRGTLMVLWDVNSYDYKLQGVERITTNVLSRVGPGSIVLMHDGGGDRSQTVAALPGIVRALRRRGLKLVTVERLLSEAPPPTAQPLPPESRPGG